MTKIELQNRVSAELPVAGALPIMAIVEAIMAVIAACKNKQEAKSEMANPGILARSLLRAEIKKQAKKVGEKLTPKQLNQAIEAACSASKNAKESDRAAVRKLSLSQI